MAVKTAQANLKITQPQPTNHELVEAIDGVIVELYTLAFWMRQGDTLPNEMLDGITHRVTWLADRLQRVPRDG